MAPKCRKMTPKSFQELSWPLLDRSWPDLGASWSGLEAPEVDLGSILSVLRLSWGHLEASWDDLRALPRPLGRHKGAEISAT